MRMTGFIVAVMVTAVIFVICVDGNEFFDHREIKVLRHLKRFNKPTVKSIKSEDGDVIDCVPITNQPAFDHPLLKNHTIQMRPSFYPVSDSTYTKKEAKAITQVWHKTGECPKNTVPIRRTKKEDLLRPKSIRSFGRKSHQSIPRTTTFDPTLGHQYTLMGVRNGKFMGLGNWWLRVNEKDIIGYWPGSLFSSLGREATRVEWGGEIINSKTGGRHTTTDMGSGHFADEGFKKASYVRIQKS
ncbi:hypothetical protein ARALYDRAFT_903838 [Arabidopsis lyrata subsp. lyrata]|uniref:Neprosin PEP catalytic domain-containing protein n=1 Tax=Arabidopsis lyrata subsp. lyrata TaxID=81972 RepID=D7LKX8_ARALL|nr:hypothetical protein ARALYDRAFT_903838 [Arabidopsis lyrata subsp. lyrata]